MYKDRQNFDNVAWDKNDDAEEESQMRLRRKDTCRQVESLVKQKCGNPATLVSPLVIGGLNIHYRVHLEGEDGVLLEARRHAHAPLYFILIHGVASLLHSVQRRRAA